VLGVLAKHRHVSREHLHSVANSHCGDPASKCVHPRFTAVSQHQSQVGPVYSNDEAGYSSACTDIHDGASDACKGVNKLPRMCNDIGNRKCAKGAEALRCP
jgi:hypothetical protein